MPDQLNQHVEAARYRLSEARKIAAKCHDNPEMHRLAMKVVFIMEDVLFELAESTSMVAVIAKQLGK